MANEIRPLYTHGMDITAHCEAAVTGGRFVTISDPKQAGSVLTAVGADQTGGGNVVVSLCGAAGIIFGVSDRDGPIGGKIGVLRFPAVVPVECGAAVTAGAQVTSDATGRAVATSAATDGAGGIALNTTTAAGQFVFVALADGTKRA
jgi:uncharacterized protein DUF2190